MRLGIAAVSVGGRAVVVVRAVGTAVRLGIAAVSVGGRAVVVVRAVGTAVRLGIAAVSVGGRAVVAVRAVGRSFQWCSLRMQESLVCWSQSGHFCCFCRILGFLTPELKLPILWYYLVSERGRVL